MKQNEEDFGGCAWHEFYSPNCDACRSRAKQEYKYREKKQTNQNGEQ